jgi:hypothetical protein
MLGARSFGVLLVVVAACGGAQRSTTKLAAPLGCPTTDVCLHRCDQGDWQACAQASRNLRIGSADDQVRAFKYAKLSCDHGEPWGCHEVATDLVWGNGTTADAKRAAPIFEKLCAEGYFVSCLALGDLYYSGMGVPKDLARGLELDKKACEADPNVQCWNLAVAARSGTGMEKDPTLAWKYLERGCNANLPNFCAGLGGMLLTGEFPRDPARANTYLHKACDLRGGWACAQVGALLVGGDFPKDAAGAEWYFRYACSLPPQYNDYDQCAEVRKLDAARQQRAETFHYSWKPFRSDVGHFIVDLPGEAQFKRGIVDGKESDALTSVTANTQAGMFTAAYMPQSGMSVAVDVEFVLAKLNATLVSNLAFGWYGQNGVEIRARVPEGGVFRARIFVVNGTLIRLVALGDDADIDHFFSSLQFF